MKKTNRKWKVFVVVLCLLFTMTPGMVFADAPVDSLQTMTSELNGPGDSETPPENPEAPATPPGTTGDPATPPGITEDPEKGKDPSSQEPEDGGILPGSKTITLDTAEKSYFNYGDLVITKEVEGKPDSIPDATFTFEIEKKHSYYPYDWYNITTVSIVGADSTDSISLRTGNYRITEQSVDDYSASPVSIETEIKKNKESNVEFINTYTGPTTGSLKISKEVSCEDSAVQIPDPEFEFVVAGPNDYTTTVALKADQSVTLNGLDPGSYTVTESTVDNFTPDDSTKTETVAIGSTAEVDFVNYYEPVNLSGSITVIKEVYGDIPESPDTFNIRIQGDNGYSDSVTVSAVSQGSVSGLEPGTYTLTEDPSLGYAPRINPIQVTVSAGGVASATFINDYTAPVIEDPVVGITKKVAEYDGVTLPSDTAFVELLNLNALNKIVLFRINITCNEAWNSDYPIRLIDLYQGSDVTDSLLTENGGALTTAAISGFPDGIVLNHNEPITLYYQVTLPANGTYTNIALLDEVGEVPVQIASSSAVVTVSYSSGGGGDNGGGGSGGGGGGGSTKYYDVTYNPNYPSGSDTSGKVPVDKNNYRYNTAVNVRGNTGELMAGDYIFKGWNTKPDGTGTMYQSGSTFNIKEDTILYAVWELATTDPGTAPSDTPMSTETTAAPTDGLDEVPKTGDETPILIILLLGLLSFVSIAAFSRKKKTAAE